MRVADYIIKLINEQGANHVFMITGRGILYLSDAVARNENIINVAMHNEQAAAYAACACAQYNQTLGACIVSTGCASTNAITGVLCAWQDQVPCVFISGQNYLRETVRYTGASVRTFGQQENDIISLVEPITKYAVMLDDPHRVVYEVEKALYLAKHGRKGPVWIDIPLDIQDARINPEEEVHYSPDLSSDEQNMENRINEIIKDITNAMRPVILAGWGVRNANAEQEFVRFANKIGIPIVFTSAVPDLYGRENDNSIGVVGAMGGSRAGNFTIQNADYVLSIGSRLSSMTTGEEYEKFLRNGKLVVVDIDDKEHQKTSVSIDKLICTDIKRFLIQITDIFPSIEKKEWLTKCIHWKNIFDNSDMIDKDRSKIDLYYLVQCMNKSMPADSIICTDAGLEELILPANLSFYSGQRCIHPVSQGAMGFALPAAIGLSCESGKTVIAVIGDGSIMMNLQEFATIAYHKFPIKIIVINNNGYSIIRKRQHDFFRNRTIGNDETDGVGIPVFEKVAAAFDIPYRKLDDHDGLKEGLQKLFQTEGPILCEIMADRDQGFIHTSYARNAAHKIVKRPLEDQSPYLDRNLFLSEMIIEPIDQ